jgi:hypothetical protein
MITSPRRMEMMTDEGIQLRQELLKMDLDLRRKQDIWENPRNIVILLGVAATIAAVVGYEIGHDLAQYRPQQIVIQLPPQAPQK